MLGDAVGQRGAGRLGARARMSLAAIGLLVAGALPACASRPTSVAPPSPPPAASASGQRQIDAEHREPYALTSGSKRLLSSLKGELRIDA